MTRIQKNYYDGDGDLHWADAVAGEKKDYAWDLDTRMTNEGDTVGAVTWDVPSGITEEDTNFTDNVATIWLSFNTVGTYEVVGQANTTDNGATQIYKRKFLIKVI